MPNAPSTIKVLMSEDYTIADKPRDPALELKKGKIESLPLHIAKIVVEVERGTFYTPPPEPPKDLEKDLEKDLGDVDLAIDDELPPVKKEPVVIAKSDVGDLADVLGVDPAMLDKAKAVKGGHKKKGKKV